MAGVLDWVYVAALLVVAILGVFYVASTGDSTSNDAGRSGDVLRAIAVTALLVYMAGSLAV